MGGNKVAYCAAANVQAKSKHPLHVKQYEGTSQKCVKCGNNYCIKPATQEQVLEFEKKQATLYMGRTDEENLEAFLRLHRKPTPQFCRQVADKTLLVGLSSTVFRAAKYTSHEVAIDDAQLKWFEDLVVSHPAQDGWKLFVFTHAPPIGSGLRVLQENHVVNGCCWLNHSGGESTVKFIKLVREHRCIKGWFSGHFHLGQDYEDSITFPTIPREVGPYPNRGSCVFAQTSVMRSGTSRDKRQQSRLLRGTRTASRFAPSITRRVGPCGLTRPSPIRTASTKWASISTSTKSLRITARF